VRKKQILGRQTRPPKRRAEPMQEGILGEVIERNGKRFKVEIWDVERFELPFFRDKKMFWKKLTKSNRKKYAIARCRGEGIRPDELPAALYNCFTNKEKLEIRRALGISERIEKLGERDFTLPLNGKEQINWEGMGKRKIVEYAIAYCEYYNIKNQKQLKEGEHKNTRLYDALYSRGLVGEVFKTPKSRTEILDGKIFVVPLIGEGHIRWGKLGRRKKIRYAKAYLKHHEIKRPSELQRGEKQNQGLIGMLENEQLVGIVFGIPREISKTLGGRKFKLKTNNQGRIAWEKMSDVEIADYAKAYCKKFGIKRPYKLSRGKNSQPYLYEVLIKRKLIGTVFGIELTKTEQLGDKEFVLTTKTNGHIDWWRLTNQQLEEYGKAYCKKHSIFTIRQLRNKNAKLENGLRRRGLVHKVLPIRYNIVELEERKFKLYLRGDRIHWKRTDKEVLNIYAAVLCRETGKGIAKLPHRLRECMDKERVKEYIDQLPILTTEKMELLKTQYEKSSLYEIPEEVLWAYGYEKYAEIREFGAVDKGVRKMSLSAPIE